MQGDHGGAVGVALEAGIERETFIAGILGGGADVPDRARKLAQLTTGMSRDEITKLLAPGAASVETVAADRAGQARQEADRLIAKRKREIIERECFGLVEFVEPQHGFDVVGGMEEVNKDLSVIDASIRDGQPRTCRWASSSRPDGHRQDLRGRSLRQSAA